MWFNNTFVNALCRMGWRNGPFKIIGDCAMFFIPEAALDEKSDHALFLFDRLYGLAAELDDSSYRDVRVCVSFCQEAYDLTFEPDRPDVYGMDISLAFRLLRVANAREVVMNEEFVRRVREIYSRLHDKVPYSEVEKIVGPWPEEIKGFGVIPIYKVAALPALTPGRWESGGVAERSKGI